VLAGELHGQFDLVDLHLQLSDERFDVRLDGFPFAQKLQQDVELLGLAVERFPGSDPFLDTASLPPCFLRFIGVVPESGRCYLALDLVECTSRGSGVKDSSGRKGVVGGGR
jgi:hypothetical protein